MEWTRSTAIGTSSMTCAHCHGLGLRKYTRVMKRAAAPCNCTTRGIFRACLNKFRELVEKPKAMTHATHDHASNTKGFRTWGRKDEEYMADFYLIAKRTLDETDFRIFRFHFLLGADWRMCCRRLDMDRGNFFHAVYRIQAALGKAFRETAPFALFPLDEYFGVITKGLKMPPAAPPTSAKLLQMPRKTLRPSLNKAA